MINFLKQNKKIIIFFTINVILLELMHKFKVHYALAEFISLAIIFLAKNKKIDRSFLFLLSLSFLIELTFSNILIRFNLPYVVTNIVSSLALFSMLYLIENQKKQIKKTYQKIDKKWLKIINSKPLIKIFTVLPQNLIVFILLIVSIISVYKYCNNYVSSIGVVYFNEPKEESTEIIGKTKLDLSFIETKDKFDKICIKTSAEKPTKITLTSGSIDKTIESNKINKYGYLCFKADGIKAKDLKNKKFYLSSEKKIKIYKSSNDQIAVELTRSKNKDLIIIDITVSLLVVLLFLTVNFLINKKKISENKIYLIFMIYSLILLFVFPPFQVPDEYAHFYRSYNYSQPEIKETINFGKKTIEVPQNINCIDYAHLHRSNKVYQIDDIKKCLISKNNKKVINIEATGSQILGYITQTIGIKLADIFTNSPLIIFFQGRLLTFLISTLITYLAIKITPKYKTLFLTLGTMLMLLQQMISYSYDSILNSVCILFTAYIVKFIYKDKKITIKNLIVPIILLTLIANIKIVYLPLALLFLLIPKEKFDGNKKKIILLFSSLFIAILLSKSLDLTFGISNSSNDAPLKQLKYLMENPFDIFKIAINTIGEKGLFYIESLVGYFGWFLIKINPIYIYVYILLYAYLIMGEDSKIEKKHIIIISIILTIIGIFGAMYIVWSNYKLLYVEGVQGRYLFPLIIPLCLILIPKKKKYKIDKKIVYSVINILLLQFILVILFTFY